MRFIALVSFAASVLAASRTTAPSGSIVVAKSGGDYSTVFHDLRHDGPYI
jgi:pectinesterase